MATNKKKPTLDDLKEHLFKYKDATIVVGNDIILDKEMFLPYNSPADYSRKSMVKTPEKFWGLYKESVYKEDVDTKNNNQQNLNVCFLSSDNGSIYINTSKPGYYIANGVASMKYIYPQNWQTLLFVEIN